MNKIRIYVPCRTVSVESPWQEIFFHRATAKQDRKRNLYPYKLSLLVTLINDLPGQQFVTVQAVPSRCCLASQQSCREQPETQCTRGAPGRKKWHCPGKSSSLHYTLIACLLSLGQPSSSKNKSVHCHKHRAHDCVSVSQGSPHPCLSAVTPGIHPNTTADTVRASSESIPLAPPEPGLPHGPSELAGRTVSVTHCGAIVGAEAALCFLPAELQLVGVRELCPACVAESLLLAGAALRDVHGHPRRPGRVPAHLWAALGVAGLIFLPRRKSTPSLLIKQQQPNWQRLIYTSENKGMSNNPHPPYLTSQCWAWHKMWRLRRQWWCIGGTQVYIIFMSPSGLCFLLTQSPVGLRQLGSLWAGEYFRQQIITANKFSALTLRCCSQVSLE